MTKTTQDPAARLAELEQAIETARTRVHDRLREGEDYSRRKPT